MSTTAAPEPSSDLVRPLDTNEALFYAFGKLGAFTTAQLLRVDGVISEAVFREALRRLVTRHPNVTWRIVNTALGPMWRRSESPVPLRLLDAPDVHDAQRVAADALAQRDRGEALFDVAWAADGEQHLVCCTVHHSLADGISASGLVIDLVALLNDVSEGRLPSAQGAPAAPLDHSFARLTTSAALAHRMARVRQMLRRPLPYLPFDAYASVTQRQSRAIFDTLPRELVEPLRAQARERDATVGGALTAAVLTALHTAEGIDELVEVGTQVSLRRRATQPIPDDAVGCYSGRVTTRHRPTRDFWRLAKACTRDVKRGMARGEPEAAILKSRGHVDAIAANVGTLVDDPVTCGRTCVLSVSNRGARAPQGSQRGIRLITFFSATANHAVGASLQLSCETLQGKAHVSLIYVTPLVSDSRAGAIWTAAREALTGAASM